MARQRNVSPTITPQPSYIALVARTRCDDVEKKANQVTVSAAAFSLPRPLISLGSFAFDFLLRTIS